MEKQTNKQKPLKPHQLQLLETVLRANNKRGNIYKYSVKTPWRVCGIWTREARTSPPDGCSQHWPPSLLASSRGLWGFSSCPQLPVRQSLLFCTTPTGRMEALPWMWFRTLGPKNTQNTVPAPAWKARIDEPREPGRLSLPLPSKCGHPRWEEGMRHVQSCASWRGSKSPLTPSSQSLNKQARNSNKPQREIQVPKFAVLSKMTSLKKNYKACKGTKYDPQNGEKLTEITCENTKMLDLEKKTSKWLFKLFTERKKSMSKEVMEGMRTVAYQTQVNKENQMEILELKSIIIEIETHHINLSRSELVGKKN